MNIRELELFKHLASTLHYGKTALECNITPSGLTRTIQRVENEIGKTLLTRNNRSVSLTPAGILFKEYCDETISRYRLLQNNLKSDSVLRGELTLFCSVTAILSILPQIFRQFRKSHPEVKIHVQTGDAANAINKLQTGDADISIAALPDHQPVSLEFIEIQKTPLLFIAPKGLPETIIQTHSNGEIDWEKTPVILPQRGLGRIRAEKWFGDKKIRPSIFSQVSGNEAILGMVSMGCGVGVVPELVLEKSILKDEIETIDISPRLEPFMVGACTVAKNRENVIVESFWKTVEKIRRASGTAATQAQEP